MSTNSASTDIAAPEPSEVPVVPIQRQRVDLEDALVALARKTGNALGIPGIQEQRSGARAFDEINRIGDPARRDEILRNVRDRLAKACPTLELA